MDYTPGVLSLEGANGAPLASTLAKQLGLYLDVYSPIQMAADFVETLEKHPRELEFIKAVPADWAESHLIAGAEIGRASGRESVGQYVWIPVGAVTLKKKKKI